MIGYSGIWESRIDNRWHDKLCWNINGGHDKICWNLNLGQEGRRQLGGPQADNIITFMFPARQLLRGCCLVCARLKTWKREGMERSKEG